MVSLPTAKLSNGAIQESTRFLPSPVIQPPAMTPAVSGVTPSRAAPDIASTDALAPESSWARTGLPLIATVSQISAPASIGSSPAGSVVQYASGTPSQSMVS